MLTQVEFCAAATYDYGDNDYEEPIGKDHEAWGTWRNWSGSSASAKDGRGWSAMPAQGKSWEEGKSSEEAKVQQHANAQEEEEPEQQQEAPKREEDDNVVVPGVPPVDPPGEP